MVRPLRNQEKSWPETVAFRTTAETKAWLKAEARSIDGSIADVINKMIEDHRNDDVASKPVPVRQLYKRKPK